jgi:hypothetical protein
MSSPASGQGIDTDSADLPPDGVYEAAEDVVVTYTFPDRTIALSYVAHMPYADRVERERVGNDEIETFDSVLTAQATVDPVGGPLITGLSVMLTGPTQTRVTDRALSTAGLFDAEIVSMSLSGDVGGITVQLRESPTLASKGKTDILDIGGGLYHIDSFFDVFTELSLDSGVNWVRADGAKRMTLTPEPGTLGLLTIGVYLSLLHRKRT